VPCEARILAGLDEFAQFAAGNNLFPVLRQVRGGAAPRATGLSVGLAGASPLRARQVSGHGRPRLGRAGIAMSVGTFGIGFPRRGPVTSPRT